MTSPSSFHFADALTLRTRELGHPLCVGLDPHLDRVPPLFRRGAMEPSAPETALAVEALLLAVLDRLAGRVAVVKPQIAFYEQLGPAGLSMLERVITGARARGLLVLLDAKRGDIGSTADAYARAYLEPSSPLRADAITLNPYLGLDSIEPFVARARSFGAGLFVLARTSNRGAGDLQDLRIGSDPLFVRVARALAPLAKELAGKETGWSNLGVVLGATWPEQAEAVRQELPNALVLVPGYGAQGATAEDALRTLTKTDTGHEGGLVSSSRGVLFPERGNTTKVNEWEAAIDEALEAAIKPLAAK